jgi:hypothetical protein
MSDDGGTSQGWVQDDLRWFGRHKLRGAMPPRGIFATTFGTPTATIYGTAVYVEGKTPLGVANGVWDRFKDLIRPTYPVVEGVYCD